MRKRDVRFFGTRRGAVLPLIAVALTGLVMMLGVVFNFSRAYAQKNQLQTAADVGALAGVLELLSNSDPDSVEKAARTYAVMNEVLGRTLPAANSAYDCGFWDDPNGTYAVSAGCGANDNAVTFTIRDTVQYMFPTLLGAAPKEISATGRAWLAFIDKTKCVKPWAMDYTNLTKVLDPSGNPERTLTSTDLERLRSWTAAQLTFELTVGDPINSGFFGPLDLSEGQGGGASEYEYNIYECSQRSIGAGDTLYSQPGTIAERTRDGAFGTCAGPDCKNGHPGVCAGEGPQGQCYNESGGVGVRVVAALWGYVGAQEPGGKFPVVVRQLVSFSLDGVRIVQQPGEGKRAIVTGHFRPLSVGGSVSSVASTIRRPILVK